MLPIVEKRRKLNFGGRGPRPTESAPAGASGAAGTVSECKSLPYLGTQMIGTDDRGLGADDVGRVSPRKKLGKLYFWMTDNS